MTTPEARVICDSVSPNEHRLTSFEIKAHRFILAEINTHRVISRNYRSSRAVPTKKLIEEVSTAPAMPVYWGQNKPGMQAAEELEGDKLWCAQDEWKRAARSAADFARGLEAFGLHKQIVNRVLEPFLWVNGVLTATEWDNFFGLRLHKDAQPEFRYLADVMWSAMKVSKPRQINPGMWHLPFVDGDGEHWSVVPEGSLEVAKKVSAARCARVSYNSFDTGKRSTVEEDLKLFDRLMGAQPFHASPCEHQATPDYASADFDCWQNPELHGNFVGWCQFRKMIPGEDEAPLPEEYW